MADEELAEIEAQEAAKQVELDAAEAERKQQEEDERLENEAKVEAAKKAEPNNAEGEGEFVVSIGDDVPSPEEEKAPEWVKELRVKHRDAAKENKDLKRKLEQYEQTKPVEIGVKPTLESCEYDSDKFESELVSWHSKKRDADKQAEEVKTAEQEKSNAWQVTLSEFAEKRTAVKAKMSNYEELEGVVDDSFSEIQKGAILQCAKDPALLIAALGNNPAKLKELSSIQDAAKFIWSASQMESQMKTGNRKVATKPEGKVVGSGGGNALDATLEKLEKEAAKTGDRSKVIRYKQNLLKRKKE